MPNPFETIVNAVPEGGEEVEGVFSCQQQGCWDIEESAMYYPDYRLLTWTCEEGHQNKVEDFEIA